MFDKWIDWLPDHLWLGVLQISIIVGLLFTSMVFFANWYDHKWPSAFERCGYSLDTSAVISATTANNSNILCKVIGPDLVERSVWLDEDGEILR